MFLFVVYAFLPNVQSITAVANGNKQKSLSPQSDDVHGHQEDLVNSRLDAIYEDGLKRVAKAEKVAKPLYILKNLLRLNHRILVRNGTSPFLFNAKKKKVATQMYAKMNLELEKMTQI